MPRHRRHNRDVTIDAAAQAEAAAGLYTILAGCNARGKLDNPATQDPIAGAFGQSSDWRQAGNLDGLTPSVLGAALNGFANGDYATITPIWEVMERRDDACVVARTSLRRKVCREVRNWQVLPADKSPEAKRQAEWLTGFYNRLLAQSAVRPARRGGLRTAVEFCLDAVAKQYACLAKEWSGEGDNLTLTLRHVPLWYFREEYGQLLFAPATGSVSGTPVDPAQWLVAAQPEAAMEAASVLVLFKRLPAHQIMTILQRWGVPRIWGETPDRKGTPGWTAMCEALSALLSGLGAAAVGGGAKINALDTRDTTQTQHIPWIEYCDRGITKIFLASHLATQAQGDTGNLAGGAQSENTGDAVGDLCDWISETFQQQIDPEALRYGYGTDEPLAYFEARRAEQRDDVADSSTLTSLVNLGLPVGVGYARQRYSIPEPEAGEETLRGSAPATPPGSGPLPGPHHDLSAAKPAGGRNSVGDQKLTSPAGLAAENAGMGPGRANGPSRPPEALPASWSAPVAGWFEELDKRLRDPGTDGAAALQAVRTALAEIPNLVEAMNTQALADAMAGSMTEAVAETVAATPEGQAHA